MKKVQSIFFLAAALFTAVLSSCNKDVSSTGTTSTTSTSTTSTSAVIAVAATTAAGESDSVYVVQQCDSSHHRDSVSVSALPAAITNYLDTSYTGYTFGKAFTVKDSAGTINNYVVIIYYNGKPVALLFDAQGNFVQVLEQREDRDMHDKGWHKGGRFHNRDGLHGDTVALGNLPSVITSYITANYHTDTLLKAFKTADSGYVVISANGGLYATVFSADGSFVKRVAAPAKHGKPTPVAESALPAAITSYLTGTYPGYVFNKAFSISASGVLQGYIVFIEANNTRYALAFDASGIFTVALPVW